MIETLLRALISLYVVIALDVLLLVHGYRWLVDAVMVRHVKRCPEHEDWVPRWSGGWLPALVADVTDSVLWPIDAVNTVATWWRGRQK